ncbi:hypothetical protein ACGFR8_08065 [Streptomyces brevispora]|uniref:hypothetical protein n=1 Tax=Streptomyces brevispora TaxID=887462 RepID=UPI0037117899
MSVEVTIDATQLERALRRPGGLGERILRRRARPVAARARQLAPGSMGDGITMRVEGTGRGMQAIIESTHPASAYVVRGTRPHAIRARRGKALRFTVGGRTLFRKAVWHPGTKANDFLAKAVREAL